MLGWVLVRLRFAAVFFWGDNAGRLPLLAAARGEYDHQRRGCGAGVGPAACRKKLCVSLRLLSWSRTVWSANAWNDCLTASVHSFPARSTLVSCCASSYPRPGMCLLLESTGYRSTVRYGPALPRDEHP